MPREIELILACCRPTYDPDRVRRTAAAGFAPARLLTTARTHRVEGFLLAGLKAANVQLPEAELALLDDRVRRARLQMLRGAAEEVRVTRAFHAAGIDVISIKGATLAMLAQGSLSLKSAWDVDLLIRPDDRPSADAALTALGYRPVVLDGRRSAREIERYMAGVKEVVWRHPERRTTIELHRALLDNRRRIEAIGMDSPRIVVDLPGNGRVETIAPEWLFGYLAVHGLQHGWMRLKWLVDIAGLVHEREAALEQWFAHAVAAGAGRAPGTALVLAHRLLGTPLSATLAAEIDRDRSVARFAGVAGRLIAGSQSDSNEMLRPTLAQHLTLTMLSCRLRPDWRNWIDTLLTQLSKPYHPHHLKVPAAMLPAFMLLWLPFRIASRLWRR